MSFLVDANVLIDYVRTDESVLALAAGHLGPVQVVRDVLEEVRQLDEADCERLGIEVVEATLEQLHEAGAARGRLSFVDRVCLLLARDRGWTVVTNDTRLRLACAESGVGVLWGLQLMRELVRVGAMEAGSAIDIAEAIGRVNRWMDGAVVEAFRNSLRRS